MNDAEPILERLRAMLAVDHYELVAGAGANDRELVLTVVPGEEACVECLMPVGTFSAIVEKHLADGGVDLRVSVIYPDA